MYLYNEKFDSLNDIANAFSKYFSNVYENGNNINLNYNEPNQPKVFLYHLHSCIIDILNSLNSLNFNSSSCPGPDFIPSIFFKNCTYAFSTPLFYLSNLPLSTGTFPDA